MSECTKLSIRTGAFIACSVAFVPITDLNSAFDLSSVVGTMSFTEIILVKPDGTVVLSNAQRWDPSTATQLVNVVDTGFISNATFLKIGSLWNLKDGWTPEVIGQRLQNNVVADGGKQYASVPIPLPPDSYDSTYQPDYYLILEIGEDVFAPIDIVDEAVQNSVFQIIVTSVLIGVVGLVCVALVIWSVSRVLTRPLNWMEQVAWRIVNHNDERASGPFNTAPNAVVCSPRTEITDLVSEFRTMIRGFSGKGASTVARKSAYEIRNEMTWQGEFHQLYSRLSTRSVFKTKERDDDEVLSDSSTGSSSQTPVTMPASISTEPIDVASLPSKQLNAKTEAKGSSGAESAPIIPAPPRSNKGRNCCVAIDRDCNGLSKSTCTELDRQQSKAWCSRLFWWIVILIVLPLLASNVAICGLVTHAILDTLPSWLETLQTNSYDIEVEVLNRTVLLRSALAASVMAEPMRDLHLFTRMAGWLILGAITRSVGILEVFEGTEECKNAPFGKCYYYKEPSLTPCACRWMDPRQIPCHRYLNDTRYLQKGFMAGQAHDADPTTGDRYKVSFPKTDYSPNSTLWWTNVTGLPGSSGGIPTHGYNTTFDRVNMISAGEAAIIPIYNYIEYLGRSKHFLGMYTSYQKDGMFMGYDGCAYDELEYAKFQSTEMNKAYVYGGENLCPIGKYGYDPRCRGWYAEGNKHWLKGGAVYITAPYLFASGVETASTATSSIYDPKNGEHVGQTSLDFTPQGLFASLKNTDSELSLVLSPSPDATGGDTVIGPGHQAGSNPAPASYVMLPYDKNGSYNRMFFEQNIVYEMKNASDGVATFNRTEEDGTISSYVIAYAPVKLRTLRAVLPDNFAHGAYRLMEFVYSLGIARPEYLLRLPFDSIKDDVKAEHKSILTLYLCLGLALSLLVCLFTCVVSSVKSNDFS